MGLVRPYTLTISGTVPNKTLQVADAVGNVINFISQPNVVGVTTTFLEASTDTEGSRTIPEPQRRYTYDNGTGAKDYTDPYDVVNITIVNFHMSDGSDFKIDLQDVEDVDYNAGTAASITNFMTDWLA